MHQKLTLTLVSKSFSALAQAVLYEDIWISCAGQARSLALTLLSQACFLRSNQKDNITAGRFIRRLHIETPSMERCCPSDLRTILDYAPSLVSYSDNRSVRRNLLQESSDPKCSPEQLFLSLTKSGNTLQRLVWTSYDDVSFHIHMKPIAQHLNHLELNFCCSHDRASVDRPPTSSSISSAITASSNSTTHTTVSTYFPTLCPGSSASSASLIALPTLALPALRTLKVKLDNSMFMVLSTWDMPVLQSLSVVSSDYSYASEGFAEFFRIHGEKITQLELGHSSASIEEHYYLTTPPPLHHSQQHTPFHASPQNTHNSRSTIPLAQWCPNLDQFICSADAEWNWQSPDWIAPHVLLPTHPTLRLIGIRDIDKRLSDDGSDPFGPGDVGTNEEILFVLEEQIGSLLMSEAFPALQYVRDMSPRSDSLRRGRTLGTTDEARVEKRKVLDFWGRVLDRCKQRHVWLEDWQGLNVTSRDLKRAELEC
ncbi:hypothetical protein BD779DRAFT_297386 [Infundibulicybe gibba]|nr:hypothetical protein BD779DRAFT_297386 [Infundibulicybe gibba]